MSYGKERRNPHTLEKKLKEHNEGVEMAAAGGDGHQQQPQVVSTLPKYGTEKTLGDLVKNNWNAGLIVALVNLPLSISLAVAAKSTPQAGVITAICSGLMSGLFGGSDFNIVGPTGALSGFLASAVMHWDSPDLAPILPVMALWTGIFVFICVALHLEKYVELFPSSVNEGFTLGVAVIIFVNQLNFAFGVQPTHRHESLLANAYETFALLPEMNGFSCFICALWLGSFFALNKTFPKIPWATVLCALGIALGAIVWSIPSISLPTLYDKFGNLDFQGHFMMKGFRADVLQEPSFYVELVPIIFVAVLETLISAKIADKMTQTRFKQVPEMVGLGLANLVTGFCGGIPATAALARTALNVKSGATNKMSALLNAIFMLFLCIFLFTFFKYLPLAVVASQVMVVAIRMVDYHAFEFYWKADKEQFWIMLFVASLSIAIDTTYGLILGMFLYLFLFAEKMMEAFSEIGLSTKENRGPLQQISEASLKEKKKAIKRKLMPSENPDINIESKVESMKDDTPYDLQGTENFVMYRFIGVVNFMNITQHEKKIVMLPAFGIVVLSLRYIFLLDSEAVGALKLIFSHLEKKDRKVIFTGLSENNLVSLHKYDDEWLRSLMEKGKIFGPASQTGATQVTALKIE